MRIRTNVAALAGAAAVGVVGGALLAARQINGPQRPAMNYGLTPFEVGVKAESVTFTASDGTHLAGWWFDRDTSASTRGDATRLDEGRDETGEARSERERAANEPEPATSEGTTRADTDGTHSDQSHQQQRERVVIICHGYRGTKSDLLGIGPGLWRAGNTVLVFDFRGNGDSGDGPQSLAHYEQRDLEAAIDFAAARRPEAEIAVVGFSMGAAVALLVAARDERVAKVVSDSAFADMRGVIATAARSRRLPPVPLVDLADHATRLRYGYRFGSVQPVEVVGRIAPRPLLIIHGTSDAMIPVEHAYRLAQAAGGNAELRLADVAHCGAYFADRPGYITAVAEFLRT